MTTVMVTGGTGFIGSWVTRKLAVQGHRVIVYSRNPDSNLLKDIIDKIIFVSGDILDLPWLIRTIKEQRVERVIHMSTVLIDPLEANPCFWYRVNVDGAMNVFEACRLMEVRRLVAISSKAVYDYARGEYAPPTNRPIDEDYPKEPYMVYGATKFFVENMGLSYNRIYGLDFLALRFTTTWGPGKQARHGMLAIHSKIIESAIQQQPLKVSRDLDRVNDLIYTKDVANGIVLACFAEKPQHRIFHLGTGKGETIRNMIEVVNRLFGKELIETDAGTGTNSTVPYYVFNIERARKELGFSPQYDLETGIKDYIDTMKRFGK